MLKIKQIEKGDLNLKKLIELSMKFDVYCLEISEVDELIAGKKIRNLRLSEIENRIDDNKYVFVYTEKEKES